MVQREPPTGRKPLIRAMLVATVVVFVGAMAWWYVSWPVYTADSLSRELQANNPQVLAELFGHSNDFWTTDALEPELFKRSVTDLVFGRLVFEIQGVAIEVQWGHATVLTTSHAT